MMQDCNEQKQKILKAIEGIDSRIAFLRDQKAKLSCQLESIPAEINESLLAVVQESASKADHTDNLEIFKGFFRGRQDVYAKFWLSRKTGKSGYSPVCKNEWKPKICQKPYVKCSDCSSRGLAPLDDVALSKHLNGECILGIYPLLQNENCLFLAVDFDGDCWQENVSAFRKTCFDENVAVAVERSRSGNGAHVWIFFEEEIPAFTARRMGSFLITVTMQKRYQLTMKSYDRIFPNQDVMPKGGFGNLIALPLQKEAMCRQNSVFIDEKGIPFSDQWQFLANLKKMPSLAVEKIAETAAQAGQITGVRMSPTDENEPPWLRLPSGRRRDKPEIKDIPQTVEIVIANRIYIKTAGVPSVILNQLKQMASFQNPEFYRKQSMRLSVFSTPRVICCAEIDSGYLSLPRGCFDDVCFLLRDYGINGNIKDERFPGRRIKAKFQGELNSEQKKAARAIIKNDTGVFVSPPGTGKTILAIYLIAKRKINTLILTHRKPLMEQWRQQLAMFLGVEPQTIGQIGGGKDKATGIIDVAMLQSLERKGIVKDMAADYGFVIVDECHHTSAVSFERVLAQVKAKYVLGLTATPYRRDGHQPIIHMQCGSVIYQVKHKDAMRHISRYQVIAKSTEFTYTETEKSAIHDLWPVLVSDAKRNDMIVADVRKVIEEGRFPIILTERREHIDILADRFKEFVNHLAILHGGVKIKARREILTNLRNCSERSKAILATGSYIGEGFDDPRLDTLFIVMPISFKGKVVQYAGRLHRQFKGKEAVYIYDYVDSNVPVLATMYKRRLKTYKAMGYEMSIVDVLKEAAIVQG